MDGSSAAQATLPVPAPTTTSQPTAATQQPKTLVRKFTPIDIKKLQGSGLDRKLAEALSKTIIANKSGVGTGTNTTSTITGTISAASARPLPVTTNVTATTTSATTTTSITASANAPPHISSTGCKPMLHSTRIAKPKITITAPADGCQPLVEQQQEIAQIKPNASDRLAHAKRLLNTKLIMKEKSKQMLQIPKQKAQTARSEPSHEKPSVSRKSRATYVDVPKKTAKTTVTSKKASTAVAAIARPQPHDIAKVLNFDTISSDTVPNPTRVVPNTPPVVLNFSLPYLGKRKADTQKPRSHGLLGEQVKTQKSRTETSHTTDSDNVECYIETPQTATDGTESLSEISTTVPNLPIRSILTGSSSLKRVETNVEPKQGSIAFPEVSPLKHPFPTTNYTKATPLPTISTFKKPSAQTVLGPVDDQISETYSEIETSSDTVIAKPVQNLIVLENKVLSAEEKIDITALRMPKSIDNISTDETSDIPHGTTSTDLTLESCSSFVLNKGKDVNSNTASSANLLLPTKTIISAENLTLSPAKLTTLAEEAILNVAKSAHSEKSPTSSSASDKISTTELKKSHSEKIEPVDTKAKSIVAATSSSSSSSRIIRTTAINKTPASVVLSGNKDSQARENHATTESRTTMEPEENTFRIEKSSFKSGGATIRYDNVECETNGVDFLTSIMDFLDATKTPPMESNLDTEKRLWNSYQKRKLKAAVPPDEKESEQFEMIGIESTPKSIVPKDTIHIGCSAQDDQGHPGDAIVEVIEYQEDEIENITQLCDTNNIIFYNLVDCNLQLCQENIQTESSGQVSVINDNNNFMTTSNIVASTTIPLKKDKLEEDSNQYIENKSEFSIIENEQTEIEDIQINTLDALHELPGQMLGLSVFHQKPNIICKTQKCDKPDNDELAFSNASSADFNNSNVDIYLSEDESGNLIQNTSCADLNNSNMDTDLSEDESGNLIQNTMESDEMPKSFFETSPGEMPDVSDFLGKQNIIIEAQTEEKSFTLGQVLPRKINKRSQKISMRGRKKGTKLAQLSKNDQSKKMNVSGILQKSKISKYLMRNSLDEECSDRLSTTIDSDIIESDLSSIGDTGDAEFCGFAETSLTDETKLNQLNQLIATSNLQTSSGRSDSRSASPGESRGEPSIMRRETVATRTPFSWDMPLKKRWASQETDISDDTSPADDDEEVEFANKAKKIKVTFKTYTQNKRLMYETRKLGFLTNFDESEETFGQAPECNENSGRKENPSTTPTADESVGQIEEISDAIVDSSKIVAPKNISVAGPRTDDDEKPCCSKSIPKAREYNSKKQENYPERLLVAETTTNTELTPKETPLAMAARGLKKTKVRLSTAVDETEEIVDQAPESNENSGRKENPSTTPTADESVGHIEEISDAIVDSSKIVSPKNISVAGPRADDDEKPCCSKNIPKIREYNLKKQENNPEPLPVAEKTTNMALNFSKTPLVKKPLGYRKIKGFLSSIVSKLEKTVVKVPESNEKSGHKGKSPKTPNADKSGGQIEEISDAIVDSSKIVSQQNVSVAGPRADDDEKPCCSKSIPKAREYNLKKQENNPEPLPVAETTTNTELTPKETPLAMAARGLKKTKVRLSTAVDEIEEIVDQAPESNENSGRKENPSTTPTADESVGQIEEISNAIVDSSKIISPKNISVAGPRADDDEKPCCSKSIPKIREYNLKIQENNPEPLPVAEKTTNMALNFSKTLLVKKPLGYRKIEVLLSKIVGELEEIVDQAPESNENYGRKEKPSTTPTADESVGQIEEISDVIVDSSRIVSPKNISVAGPRADDDEKPCCSKSIPKAREYNLTKQKNNPEPLLVAETTTNTELTPKETPLPMAKRGLNKTKVRLSIAVDETEEIVDQAPECNENSGRKENPSTTPTADESVGQIEEISDTIVDSAGLRTDDDEKPCCSKSIPKTREYNLTKQENNPEPLPVAEKTPKIDLTLNETLVARAKRGRKKKARLSTGVDETEGIAGQAPESNENSGRKENPSTTPTADESVGQIEEISDTIVDSAGPRADDDEKPCCSKSIPKTREYNLTQQENNPEPLPVAEKTPKIDLTLNETPVARAKRGLKKKARLSTGVDETEGIVGKTPESNKNSGRKGKQSTTPTTDESVGQIEEISDAIVDSTGPRADDDEKPCCSKNIPKTGEYNLTKQENNPEPLPVAEKTPKIDLTFNETPVRAKRGRKKKVRLSTAVDETEEIVGQAPECNENSGRKGKQSTTPTADESVGQIEEISDAIVDSTGPCADDDEKPFCSKNIPKTREYNLTKQENNPEPLPVAEKTPKIDLTFNETPVRAKRGRKKKVRLSTSVDETEEIVGQAPECNENSGRKGKPSTTPTAGESVGQIEEISDAIVDSPGPRADDDDEKSSCSKNIPRTRLNNLKKQKENSPEPLPVAEKTPNIEPTLNEAPLAKKKRGRKPKIQLVETIKESAEEAPPAKRQRVGMTSFDSRLLLIRSRDQLERDEKLTETTGNGPLECGLCLARTTEAKWTQHLSEHYGVGWIKGKPALNVECRSVVLSTMTNFYRDTAIKGLTCRICQRLYRSALGLLQHLENCGTVQVRIECDKCGRNYTKLSLPYHMRTCMARREFDETQTNEQIAMDVDASIPVLNNFGRAKRRSLLRAETKVKESVAELVKPDNFAADFDPKAHIKYQAPDTHDHRGKWSTDMDSFGMAFCPYKLCKFTATDLDEIAAHLNSCKLKPIEGYYCLFCKRAPPLATEAAAIKHIYKKHNALVGRDFEPDGSNYELTTDDDDTGSDDNISSGSASNYESNEQSPCSGSKNTKRVRSRPSRTAGDGKVMRVYPHRSNASEVVLKKWREIMAKHCAKSPLYPNALPTSIKVEANRATKPIADSANDTSEDESMLPVVDSHLSMKFNFNATVSFRNFLRTMEQPVEKWKQLQLYEQNAEENDLFIYVDGPVKKLAWAPMPVDIKDQYLVVVCRDRIGKYTRSKHPKRKVTRLLVFKVAHADGSAALANVQLHYAVRIPDGPVHCVAFLPSGGYDAQNNRLGLLAVGGAAGPAINIYALPLVVDEQVAQQVSGTTLQIELQPSMVLLLDEPSSILDLEEHRLVATQCLAIAWSEALPCNHIFAGFANGYVGIWDIGDIDGDNCQNGDSSFESTLVDRQIVNGVTSFMTIKYFYTGERNARGLALHYDDNGARWLAVACLSRRLVIYDILNFADPTILKEIVVTNILRDMHWPTVWEVILTAHCDLVPNNARAVVAHNPLCVSYNASKIVGAEGAVSQLHYNPALTLLVMATDNGDVIFEKVRELHLDDILPSRTNIDRRVAMMTIQCLDADVEMPKTMPEGLMMRCDPEYKTKYGLVFTPLMVMYPANKAVYENPKRITSSAMTHYTRVNCLLCNLNASGHRLTAIGYENGLLRIINYITLRTKSKSRVDSL